MKLSTRGNICPHTSNPLQLKSLCNRCRKLDILGIIVYQMPSKLGGDWAASSAGIISDGFKSRSDAEEWALNLRGSSSPKMPADGV